MHEIDKMFYEEWALKVDSPPGWEIIPEFVKKLIDLGQAFTGLIFLWDSQLGCFVCDRRLSDENKYEFLEKVREVIKKMQYVQ